MLSFVEITSQKNNTVYRNIDSDMHCVWREGKTNRGKNAREKIQWTSIKTLHMRDNIDDL